MTHSVFEMEAVGMTANAPANGERQPAAAIAPRASGWTARMPQPASATSPGLHRSVLQLQRLVGNQCVQRMALLARQAVGPTEAGHDVEQTIQSKRGGGSPLETPVRGQMERAFGADFGGVRVHQDRTSDSLNQTLQARAFTTGQDIFFRQGAYQPGTSSGRELIAHELTHVVQQNGDRVEKKVQTKMSVSQPGDAYEIEADRMAQSVMRQEALFTPAAESRQSVDRQPETHKPEDEEKKKIHRACACGAGAEASRPEKQD